MTVRRPLQERVNGERVVIAGAGEQAEVAFEYLTDDRPHRVAPAPARDATGWCL